MCENVEHGFACAIAAGLIARLWFARYLGVLDALALGVLVGVFAQVGDLVAKAIAEGRGARPCCSPNS